jgi:antitoxin (DNA-binding transcriptional repressor) of toxin-antitoxin stability system
LVGEVARSGRPVLVTRHGEPVAAIVPIEIGDLDSLLLGKVSRHLEQLCDEGLGVGRAREEAFVAQLAGLAKALAREA